MAELSGWTRSEPGLGELKVFPTGESWVNASGLVRSSPDFIASLRTLAYPRRESRGESYHQRLEIPRSRRTRLTM
jgi:hypothetical protein